MKPDKTTRMTLRATIQGFALGKKGPEKQNPKRVSSLGKQGQKSNDFSSYKAIPRSAGLNNHEIMAPTELHKTPETDVENDSNPDSQKMCILVSK